MRFAKTLFACLFVVALAACNPSPQPAPEPAPAPPAPETSSPEVVEEDFEAGEPTTMEMSEKEATAAEEGGGESSNE